MTGSETSKETSFYDPGQTHSTFSDEAQANQSSQDVSDIEPLINDATEVSILDSFSPKENDNSTAEYIEDEMETENSLSKC